MIEPDFIERVLQRKTAWISCALIIAVRTSRIVSGGLAHGDGCPRQPIRRGKDAAQVIGGMSPFGREPGVVEIQPADHRADVERRMDGIELKLRARHSCAMRDDGSRNDGTEQLRAGRILQRFQSAAEGIDQTIARGRLYAKLELRQLVVAVT